MAFRTTAAAVRNTLDVGDEIDVTDFIITANALTNYVVTQDTNSILTTSLQEGIERYLAAYYCAMRDPQYKSKSTGGASATFLDRDWWKAACQLDLTGTLTGLTDGGGELTVDWLGKAVDEKVDFWTRNGVPRY